MGTMHLSRVRVGLMAKKKYGSSIALRNLARHDWKVDHRWQAWTETMTALTNSLRWSCLIQPVAGWRRPKGEYKASECGLVRWVDWLLHW